MKLSCCADEISSLAWSGYIQELLEVQGVEHCSLPSTTLATAGIHLGVLVLFLVHLATPLWEWRGQTLPFRYASVAVESSGRVVGTLGVLVCVCRSFCVWWQ